ncbi:4'-phosphopantetheinyl transferase superfamily protein [Streptomyces sp. Ag109_G2-6]|uniref:4'-phosphopantetheinyl transferase family protein n=1 Tax=Streptomyces TaxID=1883 RepID=UPI000F50B0A8|nr:MULTISPECIES: 4'-phosphopantetheinyl transferase superfamily protein [Streptomyces]RPF29550.1 4'-phosphopantetheinyl transferase superfamily protein [Streptomyces sp. Ag109_G2-6]
MDTVFLPLAPGRVHHWGGAGLLVAHRPDLTHLPLCLSPAEQRVARALPAWRRSEWMAGRLLAKRLAGELLGAPAREVEVLPRDDGSPQLLVGGLPLPRVHVSISHTPGHAAAALAWRPVGVDLCETASAAAVRRVADHAFSAGELSLIGPDRAEALAGAWALKEAAVKADRSGVFGPAPRRVPLLGLRPPALGGPRRAMAWRTEEAVVALVLTGP